MPEPNLTGFLSSFSAGAYPSAREHKLPRRGLNLSLYQSFRFGPSHPKFRRAIEISPPAESSLPPAESAVLGRGDGGLVGGTEGSRWISDGAGRVDLGSSFSRFRCHHFRLGDMALVWSYHKVVAPYRLGCVMPCLARFPSAFPQPPLLPPLFQARFFFRFPGGWGGGVFCFKLKFFFFQKIPPEPYTP